MKPNCCWDWKRDWDLGLKSLREETGLGEMVEAIDDAGDDRKIDRGESAKNQDGQLKPCRNGTQREDFSNISCRTRGDFIFIFIFFVESGEVELGRM